MSRQCVRNFRKQRKRRLRETDDEAKGNVTDLSDIARMKNLHTLILDRQQITDLSGLEGLPIRELSLSGNPLEHVEVLETLTELESLHLEQTKVTDLTPVSKLPALKFLDIAGGGLEKIAPLAGSSVESLETFTISGEDYEVLKQLPLVHLVVHSWSARLEEIIGETEVEELSPISSLKFLYRLGLENSRILDFAPLKEMNNLGWLSCDKTQMEEIRKIINQPWFEIQLYDRTKE